MSVQFAIARTEDDLMGWQVACFDGQVRDGRVFDVASYDEQVAPAVAAHELVCNQSDCAYYGGSAKAIEPASCGDDLYVETSSHNAVRVLALLGYEFDGDGDVATAADFKGRVLMAMGLAPQDEGMPGYDDTRAGQAGWVECGRRPGYDQAKLAELLELADFALSQNREVSWS